MAEYIEKDAFIRSIEGNPFTTESVKSYIRVSVKTFPAADVRENTIRTQADRIRAMSDDELAMIIMCPTDGKCPTLYPSCYECALHWLRSSAGGTE